MFNQNGDNDRNRFPVLGISFFSVGAFLLTVAKFWQEGRLSKLKEAKPLESLEQKDGYYYIEGQLTSPNPILATYSGRECLRYKLSTDRLLDKKRVVDINIYTEREGHHPYQYSFKSFEFFDSTFKKIKMGIMLDSSIEFGLFSKRADMLSISHKFPFKLRKIYQKTKNDNNVENEKHGSDNVNLVVNNNVNTSNNIIYGENASNLIGWRFTEHALLNNSKYLLFGDYDHLKQKMYPSRSNPVVSVHKMSRDNYIRLKENQLWWQKALPCALMAGGIVVGLVERFVQ